MPKTFTIKAGPSAYQHILKNGLSPDDISVMPAAAGGPKWIALYAFDKYLMTHWFKDRQLPLHLVGASAGAWRMLCYSLNDSVAALDRLLKNYVEQHYATFPTLDELSQKIQEIVGETLGSHGIIDLMKDPIFKLYIISSNFHFTKKTNSKYRRQFLKVVLKNSISRKWMASELKRIVFTTTDDADVIIPDDFETNFIRFTNENAIPAISSTGTLPLYMNPVDIPDVNGLLFDGALVDYHIGMNYRTDGLILYPHFDDKIIEGWFDKFIPWRKFSGPVLDRMILISPSKKFVDSLPDKKIPTREDFETYMNDKDQRINNWYEVARRGKEMAEEFHEVWKSGKLGEVVELL